MDTNQLTFTRFLAAILIVIYHFGNIYFPFNQPIIKNVVENAHLGVGYFFLLSGFVMAIAYSGRHQEIAFGGFIKNRIARIWPLYFAALLLTLLYYYIRIYILKMDSKYYPNLFDTILSTTLMQSWFEHRAATLNVAAWSLSVEWFFYLVFPFLYNRIYRKFSLRAISLGVLCFLLISQSAYALLLTRSLGSGTFYLHNPLLHVGVFLTGNILGLYCRRLTQPRVNYMLGGLITGVLTIVLIKRFYHGPMLENVLFLFAFVPLLLLIIYSKNPMLDFLKHDFFKFLGEASYGIYILQFPIFFFYTATLKFLGYEINQILFYIFLIILTGLSCLSFHFLEKPIREKIRKVTKKSLGLKNVVSR